MQSLLKVLDRPCDQCPFIGKCHLAPGRMKQIVDDCHRIAHEKHFLCHKTTTTAGAVGVEPVMCRGFHNAYPECSQIQQVAARLGLLEEVTLTQALDRTLNPKIRRHRMPRERSDVITLHVNTRDANGRRRKLNKKTGAALAEAATKIHQHFKRRRPGKDEGPACIGCGCTHEFACEGGCTWINANPPICSSCGPAWMIAELWRVLGILNLAHRLHSARAMFAEVKRLRRVYNELSRAGAVPSLKSLIRFKTAELSSPGKNEGKKRQSC